MIRHLRIIFPGLIAWGTTLFLCLSVAADPAPNIAILKSDNLKATKRSLHGGEKIISQEHPGAVFHEFLVDQSDAQDLKAIDSIKAIKPDLILSIGSSATQLAKDNFKTTPIVFCAVKYPVLSGFIESTTNPGGNMTGASLNIPTEIQFTYFKTIVPNLKKVGVLYTSNTAKLIPPAAKVAKKLGLELVALEVVKAKELSKALDSLVSTVDGIWSVADPNLFTSKATKYILLNTLRRSVPFMGFSRNVVESGALFALDFDYKAVGFQAGNIANRILAGARPDTIDVTSADVIWFHYNENTSERIKLTIPDELVAVAKEVYR